MSNFLRKLRIAFSVACGIVCLLLVIMWVRSYGWEDTLSGQVLTEPAPNSLDSYTKNNIYLISFDGIILFYSGTVQMGFEPWMIESEVQPNRVVRDMPWQFDTSNGDIRIRMRYYLPIIAFASLGLIPWIRWSTKFSLRTLLIATTLVAVLLGAIVYAVR